MAITCDRLPTMYGVNVNSAHAVINNYRERDKDSMIVVVEFWKTKQDYLDKFPPMEDLILIAPIQDIVSEVNPRTGIYSWLMQQPQFANAVADMDDDFPVN